MMNTMLGCHDVMRQLWDYLDGELTPERMAAIREHLGMCARCQPHADFERAFLDALGKSRLEPEDLGPLGDRVRTALHGAGFHLHHP